MAEEKKAADLKQRKAELAKQEQERKLAESKKANEAKQLAEAKKAAEAKKVAEAKQLAEAKKAAEAKKIADAKQLADAKKAADAKKIADAKQLADAKKAADAAKAKAALANKAPVAANTKSVVQVAAFKSDDKAQQIHKEVQALGLPSSVARVGNMARVRVGPYRNPADAEKAAAKIKLHGFNALIMQY